MLNRARLSFWSVYDGEIRPDKSFVLNANWVKVNGASVPRVFKLSVLCIF